MKRIIVMVLIAASLYSNFAMANTYSETKPTTDNDWDKLLTAMSIVESGGKANIKKLDVNHRYSYGCLQIQELYLQDSGLGYKVDDLYNKDVSFAVARAYLSRYARSYEKRTGKPATYEVLARIHNGGPRGAERSATNGYWTKVKFELEKNI